MQKVIKGNLVFCDLFLFTEYGIRLGDVTQAWANPADFGAGNPLVLRVQDRLLESGTEIVAEFRAD